MEISAVINYPHGLEIVEVTTISISTAVPGHQKTPEKGKCFYIILREKIAIYGIDSGYYPSGLFKMNSNSSLCQRDWLCGKNVKQHRYSRDLSLNDIALFFYYRTFL